MHINIKEADVPGTYMITNNETSKFYVGSTTDLRRRALRHARELKDREHHNKELQQLHDKGEELTFIGMPTENKEDALDLEQALIDDFYDSGLMCNMALDARDSAKGLPLSPEHKAKLIAANTGVPKSKEHKEAISKTLAGRTLSPEHAKKVRTANLGKKFTDEHKTRISLGNLGKTVSEEAKMKMSLAHTGKVLSEEHKQKLSLNSARTGKPMPEDNKQKLIESNQKKVIAAGIEYNSITEAAIANGVSLKVIITRLKSDKYPDFKRL